MNKCIRFTNIYWTNKSIPIIVGFDRTHWPANGTPKLCALCPIFCRFTYIRIAIFDMCCMLQCSADWFWWVWSFAVNILNHQFDLTLISPFRSYRTVVTSSHIPMRHTCIVYAIKIENQLHLLALDPITIHRIYAIIGAVNESTGKRKKRYKKYWRAICTVDDSCSILERSIWNAMEKQLNCAMRAG